MASHRQKRYRGFAHDLECDLGHLPGVPAGPLLADQGELGQVVHARVRPGQGRLPQLRRADPDILLHQVEARASSQQLPADPGLHKVRSPHEGSSRNGSIYC